MNRMTKIQQLRKELYQEYIALSLEIIKKYSSIRKIKIAPYAYLPNNSKAYIWIKDGKIVKDVNNYTENLGFSNRKVISSDTASKLIVSTFNNYKDLYVFTKTILKIAKKVKEGGKDG